MPQELWDVLTWLAKQLPVLAATALVVRWVLDWNGRQKKEEIARIEGLHAAVVAEKDTRLADRDKSIAKLEDRIKELEAKFYRPRRKKGKNPSGGNES